ncbi:DUF2080 family transposase-associated protein [archaeon]|nr:DUF2080 family transposase-associated protein [archaeon]
MKIIIEKAEAIVETKVRSYRTSTRVSVPKKWANKKVKIVLVRE